METALNIISWACLLFGCFLLISGAIGILRLPDFYTRLHAAGVTDTLAATMILTGLMLQSDELLVLAKLTLIILFTLFTSPTASHALAKAAYQGGLRPGVGNPGNQENHEA